MRINREGELIWEQNYGGSEWDFRSGGMIMVNEKEAIIAGITSSNDFDLANSISPSYDAWLFRIDTDNGDLLYSRDYGGHTLDSFDDIVPYKDGFLIFGNTRSDDIDVLTNNGGSDFWLIYVLNDGTIVWSQTWGGSDAEFARDMFVMNEEEIWLLGRTSSEEYGVEYNFKNYDALLMRVFLTDNLDKSAILDTGEIYPNPITNDDVLTIRFKEAILEPIEVKVFNALGQNISNTLYQTPFNLLQIETQNMSSGTYFFYLETSTDRTIYKVIIL